VSMIKRFPLISYFIIAYLFSWTFWLPVVAIGEDAPLGLMLLTLLGGFGPLFAAFLVIYVIDGKQKLKALARSIVNLRVGVGWLLAVLLMPFILLALTYGVHFLAGGPPVEFASFEPIYLYPAALVFATLLGGGLEEPGWRGYALPYLQNHYSPLVSSLILAPIWTFWHLPLFFSELTTQYEIPIGLYLLGTFGLTIIFTWLFNKTGGSVFLAILFHGGINAAAGWYPITSRFDTVFGHTHAYALLALAMWIAAIILLVFFWTRSKVGNITSDGETKVKERRENSV
jgi:uncharacterized protein